MDGCMEQLKPKSLGSKTAIPPFLNSDMLHICACCERFHFLLLLNTIKTIDVFWIKVDEDGCCIHRQWGTQRSKTERTKMCSFIKIQLLQRVLLTEWARSSSGMVGFGLQEKEFLADGENCILLVVLRCHGKFRSTRKQLLASGCLHKQLPLLEMQPHGLTYV